MKKIVTLAAAAWLALAAGTAHAALKVLAPLFVAALGISLVSFAFNDRIVSRATRTLDRWEKADFGPLPKDATAPTNVWVRDGTNLINARAVHGKGDGTWLEDVTIYNRGSGALDAIIRAPEARTSGRKVEPACSYVATVIQRNKEFQDLLG